MTLTVSHPARTMLSGTPPSSMAASTPSVLVGNLQSVVYKYLRCCSIRLDRPLLVLAVECFSLGLLCSHKVWSTFFCQGTILIARPKLTVWVELSVVASAPLHRQRLHITCASFGRSPCCLPMLSCCGTVTATSSGCCCFCCDDTIAVRIMD